jgi:hypothetical protein
MEQDRVELSSLFCQGESSIPAVCHRLLWMCVVDRAASCCQPNVRFTRPSTAEFVDSIVMSAECQN